MYTERERILEISTGMTQERLIDAATPSQRNMIRAFLELHANYVEPRTAQRPTQPLHMHLGSGRRGPIPVEAVVLPPSDYGTNQWPQLVRIFPASGITHFRSSTRFTQERSSFHSHNCCDAALPRSSRLVQDGLLLSEDEESLDF